MWLIKQKRKQTAANIVAKSDPLSQAARMSGYNSLININPYGSDHLLRVREGWRIKQGLSSLCSLCSGRRR